MTLSKKDQEQIKKLMSTLGLSEAEALQVLEDDKAIDKGVKLFELTEEQKIAEKQARMTGSNASKGKTKSRERKADTDKADIIAVVKSAIESEFDIKVEVVNAERELLFIVGERKFKVVLSAPRS